MRFGSIRFRLVALWAIILSLTLYLASYGLQLLFERSLLRRTMAELSADLVLLAEAIDSGAEGSITLASAPRDPLFGVAYGGRYWQITRGGEPVLRSPSLWAFKLAVPANSANVDTRTNIRLAGPDDQDLFAIVRQVPVASGADQRPLTITVAADYQEIAKATQRFADDLLIGLALLAALLAAAAWMQVVIGLRPLREIQIKLASVRRGDTGRLTGDFPTEVRPLVIETNALLDAQDAALATARTRAGDLAHGLKTPLAVMASQSRTLRRRGDHQIAEHLDRQIELMRRHVERELARTRSRGTGPTHHARIDTGAAIRRLVHTFQLLPRGQELQWKLELTDNLCPAVDATDFDELMGNLLDNAHKWAKSTVSVRSRTVEGKAVFLVEDDGPGIPDADVGRILKRGERADTSVAGSGLGLAIVGDLVAAYRGTLEISRSPLGGVTALFVLDDAPGGAKGPLAAV